MGFSNLVWAGLKTSGAGVKETVQVVDHDRPFSDA
jgi:hypothetical protein